MHKQHQRLPPEWFDTLKAKMRDKQRESLNKFMSIDELTKVEKRQICSTCDYLTETSSLEISVGGTIGGQANAKQGEEGLKHKNAQK